MHKRIDNFNISYDVKEKISKEKLIVEQFMYVP